MRIILKHSKGSIQFNRSAVSECLRPHGLQHARPPCPSPAPRVYWNACPLSWWCHPIISSSVIPFSCLQSFPASGSFQISQFFTSGSQRIGVSASASVLPVNIQDWSSLGWTGWISYSPRDSQESSPTPQFKSINSSALSFLYSPTHVHRAGDAIQPSHPLSSPSPPSFNLSQHQSLVKWVSSSHQVAKVLEFQLQHQSFQWIFRTDLL